ncbi:cupin domain-containing protein [Novosphingobium album (ex Liu et al. 2023)]|uniref:Cupin domain-containing protein n=1 Tax=Novosphingobium album (ex Liu et al. 2023) TaxID=3031130 RepID=A0ABT5WXG8_9SPHN|nr:cupin domain-containing protein [Novosphingobium album (ex Liu et al. 2023)]MDE8654574.1 cupin domain-containing protein [Novosphingobium album (ex Liu et al. 2023)]
MSHAPRRIVAGLGADGKSRLVADGPVATLDLGPMTIAQLWTGALAARADSTSPVERATGPFRFEQMAEPGYAFMIAEYAPGLGRDDPGMHFTETADHFYVIAGEVVLVLEAEEVVLRAGDAGVCRAVVHGWRNDGDAIARLVTFVLPATGVY